MGASGPAITQRRQAACVLIKPIGFRCPIETSTTGMERYCLSEREREVRERGRESEREGERERERERELVGWFEISSLYNLK